MVKIGYTSVIKGQLRLKKGQVRKFKKAVEKLKAKVNKLPSNKQWGYDFIHYFLNDDLEIIDRRLEWAESYSKWYGDLEFIKFVAPFVEEGKLYFDGEDGEKWGYSITKEGKIFNIEFVEKIGSEVK